MTIHRSTALALAALLAGTAPAGAQTSRDDPSDFQTWYSAAVNVNLPNKWEASMRYRLRLEDNSSAYAGSYLTGELGFQPLKGLTLLGDYRLALADDGTYHRVGAGFDASRKVGGGTTLSFRPMLQYQRQDFADDDEGGDEDLLLRTRFRARHRVSKPLDVYASTEPYFTFQGGEHPVDNWRNTVGLQYEYAKDRKIDLFYIYRPDYARDYNRSFHVVGVNLEFDLKWPRRGR